MVAQRLVAGAIARALGTFCELDESAVESNLLNKARITLNNLRLKPKVIKQTDDFSIVLHGQIKSGVFKWKWSSKGLLRKCTFIVTGLQITLKPVSGSSKHCIPPKEKSDTELELDMDMEMDAETKKDKKNWKDKLALRILEQLAVIIEDIQIVIETPRNVLEENMPWKRQVMLFGKNIEIESLGRINKHKFKKNGLKIGKASAPLLQELKIGSLSAKVVIVDKNGNAKAFPMILPFQYFAIGKRVHGNRFASLVTGLEVEGKNISSMRSRSYTSFKRDESSVLSESFSFPQCEDSDSVSTPIMMDGDVIEVFADVDEIETSLCTTPSLRLSPMSQNISWNFASRINVNEDECRDEFIQVENQNDYEATDELHLVLGDEQLMALFSVLNMFKSDVVEDEEEDKSSLYYRNTFMRPGALGKLTKVAPTSFTRSTRSIVKASKFNFPFPFVHVSLPGEDVEITAEDCVIKMKADNSTFKIYGTGEVTFDNETVLRDGAMWTVELIKKEISIEQNNGTSSNHWDWKFNQSEDDHKDPLTVDCSQLSRLKGFISTVLEKKKLAQRRRVPETPIKSSSSWSLNLKGNTTLKF